MSRYNNKSRNLQILPTDCQFVMFLVRFFKKKIQNSTTESICLLKEALERVEMKVVHMDAPAALHIDTAGICFFLQSPWVMVPLKKS